MPIEIPSQENLEPNKKQLSYIPQRNELKADVLDTLLVDFLNNKISLHDIFRKPPGIQRDFFLKMLEKKSVLVTVYLNDFKNKPWAKDIILAMVQDHPMNILIYLNDFLHFPWAKEVVEKLIEKDFSMTFMFYSHFKDQKWTKDILRQLAYKLSKKPLQEVEYLHIARIINDLHDEPDEIRFILIQRLEIRQLYRLIIDAREEVFTSTYAGILRVLLLQVSQPSNELFEMIRSENFYGIHVFIEAAATYGKIDVILQALGNTDQQQIILEKITDENIIQWSLRNYVALMEIIWALRNNPRALTYIARKIEKNYTNGEGDVRLAWWIIWKYASHIFPWDHFLSQIDESYDLQELSWVKIDNILDIHRKNIQQYFFYNDPDGGASYRNFLSYYTKSGIWKITQYPNYVTISWQAKWWNSVILYANKPEYDGSDSERNGIVDIQNAMKQLGQQETPNIIVHRGHSYHAQKTIKNISTNAQIVFLGSCWGFQNIEWVLKKSPHAHIISTKWVGTKNINDPILFSINENILAWKDIVWEKIWTSLPTSVKDNEHFDSYVRPDTNLWVLFQQKLKNLTETYIQKKIP